MTCRTNVFHLPTLEAVRVRLFRSVKVERSREFLLGFAVEWLKTILASSGLFLLDWKRGGVVGRLALGSHLEILNPSPLSE
jgi:hypothetical protein